MRVKMVLFAGMRERLGSGGCDVEVPEGALVRDAVAELGRVLGSELSDEGFMTAVNRKYVLRTEPLRDGDEVALIPPVSGGSGEGEPTLVLGEAPLDEGRLRAAVSGPRYGAVAVFSGVTRGSNGGREVLGLWYEAYEEMALSVMRWIVKRLRQEWEVGEVAIGHRLGDVGVGETSMVIAVSAVHRREAFGALEYLSGELKSIVPIWKKERFADGDEWV